MNYSIKDFCEVTTNYYYSNPKNLQIILKADKDTRPTKKEGKYKIVSFADKEPRRQSNMNKLKNKFNQYDLIDEVKVYKLSDIPEEFYKKHKPLFDSNRYFPWISKIYSILNTLYNSDDNDVILWVDSDIVDIKQDGVELPFNLCNNSEHGLVGFHSDFWMEHSFTKKDLLIHLNMNKQIYYDTNQAYGLCLVVKKKNFTIKFVEQWLEISSVHNLFDDSPSKNKNSDLFITHKHDQSILSLLLKLHNIKTFPLPLYDLDKNNIIANHSGYFEPDTVLPFTWEPCWHNITLEQMWYNSNKKFNRKVSPQQCLSASVNYFHETNHN